MRKRQTFEPRPTDTHHMVIVHRLNPVKKRFGVLFAYSRGHRGPQQAEVERIMFAALYFRRFVSDDLCSSEDGTEEVVRVPAEVWLKNEDEFTKWFNFTQPVVQITLDPFLEMADTDRSDNYWPALKEPNTFDVYSRGATSRWQRKGNTNPMREARAAEAK